MTDITIPPEALEAAAFHLPGYHSRDLWPHVEAAILAALNAWPGFEYRADGAFPAFGYGPEAIVLPLPHEASE